MYIEKTFRQKKTNSNTFGTDGNMVIHTMAALSTLSVLLLLLIAMWHELFVCKNMPSWLYLQLQIVSGLQQSAYRSSPDLCAGLNYVAQPSQVR